MEFLTSEEAQEGARDKALGDGEQKKLCLKKFPILLIPSWLF